MKKLIMPVLFVFLPVFGVKNRCNPLKQRRIPPYTPRIPNRIPSKSALYGAVYPHIPHFSTRPRTRENKNINALKKELSRV